jgi:hypothetical protein
MFFPVLRGKRFELHAIRDLQDKLVEWGTAIPIIEPVRRGGLGPALDALVGDGVQFVFLVNPRVGEFVDSPKVVQADFVAEYLDEYDNYTPALYVDRETTARQISEFASRFEIGTMFFLLARPADQTLRAIISAEPAYVAIRDRRAPESTIEALRGAAIELVEVTDPFRREVRNSDYPDHDFFSDQMARIPNEIYGHFGDYSIVGDSYIEGGGAAYTVALHHIIGDPQEHTTLNIMHYKSDPSETTANVAGKFAEALERLVNDQANARGPNDTSALKLYRELHSDEHFPGLGFAKKLGLMQHIEVVARTLEGR